MKATLFCVAGVTEPNDSVYVRWVHVTERDIPTLLKMLHLPQLDTFELKSDQLLLLCSAIADQLDVDGPVETLSRKLDYQYKPEYATASYLRRILHEISHLARWAHQEGHNLTWKPA